MSPDSEDSSRSASKHLPSNRLQVNVGSSKDELGNDLEDIEMSDRSKETSGTQDISTPTPSKSHLTRARIQFFALCWCMFLAGWNDGSTGPLLPRIQKVYHVSLLRYVFRCYFGFDAVCRRLGLPWCH
jgi:fucose permease